MLLVKTCLNKFNLHSFLILQVILYLNIFGHLCLREIFHACFDKFGVNNILHLISIIHPSSYLHLTFFCCDSTFRKLERVIFIFNLSMIRSDNYTYSNIFFSFKVSNGNVCTMPQSINVHSYHILTWNLIPSNHS